MRWPGEWELAQDASNGPSVCQGKKVVKGRWLQSESRPVHAHFSLEQTLYSD